MRNRDKNKNSETLKSFVAYCEANPELRFWQALRNWSGWGFILVSNGVISLDQTSDAAFDTFFWEGRDRNEQ